MYIYTILYSGVPTMLRFRVGRWYCANFLAFAVDLSQVH